MLSFNCSTSWICQKVFNFRAISYIFSYTLISKYPSGALAYKSELTDGFIFVKQRFTLLALQLA